MVRAELLVAQPQSFLGEGKRLLVAPLGICAVRRLERKPRPKPGLEFPNDVAVSDRMYDVMVNEPLMPKRKPRPEPGQVGKSTMPAYSWGGSFSTGFTGSLLRINSLLRAPLPPFQLFHYLIHGVGFQSNRVQPSPKDHITPWTKIIYGMIGRSGDTHTSFEGLHF